MAFIQDFKSKLSSLTPDAFEEAALELFRYQAKENQVYASFLQGLPHAIEKVEGLEQIPFLPIEFFKTHPVVSHSFEPKTIFLSSGTTLQQRSRHLVANPDFYCRHAQTLFEDTYGPLKGTVVLALLPSYLEQGDSSLVMMIDHFIKTTGQQQTGFYLHNHQDLRAAVAQAKAAGQKIYLFGVTYALLDLAEDLSPGEFSGLTVFETGGMKGRRREMVREELHHILTTAFGVEAIHSEYGMTELLSQAYSTGQGIFQPSRTLQVLVRDVNDPFAVTRGPASGGINVIDLANADSCAFIETKDLGKLYTDGTFEVLGRFDNSDIRGCNLLVG
ncbi:acyl transferase [Nibribacter ruber]|uniref:Acyl transferase n=1 Tax=Nibribacter ruber TaxID=2698458 RepID=A0A6P1NS17_9BACT|nr:acyl transferase [Nibribacter ruber]QHL86626.1 acyl transferase [Nibribacter ruber]